MPLLGFAQRQHINDLSNMLSKPNAGPLVRMLISHTAGVIVTLQNQDRFNRNLFRMQQVPAMKYLEDAMVADGLWTANAVDAARSEKDTRAGPLNCTPAGASVPIPTAIIEAAIEEVSKGGVQAIKVQESQPILTYHLLTASYMHHQHGESNPTVFNYLKFNRALRVHVGRSAAFRGTLYSRRWTRRQRREPV